MCEAAGDVLGLASMLRRKHSAAMRKAHLFALCRHWSYRSDAWRRKGARQATGAGALQLQAAAPSMLVAEEAGWPHVPRRGAVAEAPLALARAPATQWDVTHGCGMFEVAGSGLSGLRVTAQGAHDGLFPISAHSAREYRAVGRLCEALLARTCSAVAEDSDGAGGSSCLVAGQRAYLLQYGSCKTERTLALCSGFLDGMSAILQVATANVAAAVAAGTLSADALAALRCAEDEWEHALDNARKALALLRMLLARSRLEDEAAAFAAVQRDVTAACAHSLAVAARSYDARAAWAEQAMVAAAACGGSSVNPWGEWTAGPAAGSKPPTNWCGGLTPPPRQPAA